MTHTHKQADTRARICTNAQTHARTRACARTDGRTRAHTRAHRRTHDVRLYGVLFTYWSFVRCTDGTVVTGCNVENVSYGLSI